MNNKIKSIIKFNLYKNIQNKWFIILNVVMLIVTIIGINFNSFKNIVNINKDKDRFTINVYDENNLLFSELTNDITDNLKNKINVVNIDSESELNEVKNKLNNNCVIVEIRNNFSSIKIISKEGIKNNYYQFIYDNIKEIKNEDYAIKHNISVNDLNEILSEPKVERIMLNVNNKDSNVKTFLNQASNYVIFLVLMIVLSKIANDISQEKMSKSIEYILTSISEKDYLISKVISVNLLVIIQMIFAFIYYIIANSINRIININSFNNVVNMSSMINVNIDSTILIYIVSLLVLVILTVIMLTTIQAAISSKTTNSNEASNSTFLLVMINMVIYFIASFLITPLKTPNIITYIVSCIPIISMYFIPSMIIVGNYNLIIVPISIIINIIAIPYIFEICSKIFKKGILNTSGKVKKIDDKNIKDKIKEENIKNNYKRVGFVTGIAIILYIVINNILVLIFGAFTPKITIFPKTTVDIITQCIIFILSLYLPSRFVRLYNENEKSNKNKKINIKQVFKDLTMCLSIVIILQVVLNYILEKLGINSDIVSKLDIYKFSNNFDKILFFIQIAVLPAIFEELFIRKELLNLSKKISVKFGIIFTAIIFAAIHLNLSQSIFAFIMGIMLAIIAVKYNSIKISGLIHLLNNGTAALTLIFEDNKIITSIISLFIGIIFIIGIVNLICEIISKIKNKKLNIELNFNKDIKYLFYDYTFVITTIFIIILFILTEIILKKM